MLKYFTHHLPQHLFKEVLPEDPVIAIDEILDDTLTSLAISEMFLMNF